MNIFLARRPLSQPEQDQDPANHCPQTKHGDRNQKRIVSPNLQGAFHGPAQLSSLHNLSNLLNEAPLMLDKKPPCAKNRLPLGTTTGQRRVIPSLLVAVEEENFVNRVNLGLRHQFNEEQIIHIGDRFVERVER